MSRDINEKIKIGETLPFPARRRLPDEPVLETSADFSGFFWGLFKTVFVVGGLLLAACVLPFIGYPLQLFVGCMVAGYFLRRDSEGPELNE